MAGPSRWDVLTWRSTKKLCMLSVASFVSSWAHVLQQTVMARQHRRPHLLGSERMDWSAFLLLSDSSLQYYDNLGHLVRLRVAVQALWRLPLVVDPDNDSHVVGEHGLEVLENRRNIFPSSSYLHVTSETVERHHRKRKRLLINQPN